MADASSMETPICSVMMDGDIQVSDDFVAVLSKPDGGAAVFYNTDAMTLGMSIKLIAHAYLTLMQEVSEDEQSEIVSILGDAFDPEGMILPEVSDDTEAESCEG